MIGTIKFSSRIRYGRNKRNIPFYQFITNNDEKIVVASKKGRTTKIDYYAIIEIIDNTSTPKRGALKQLIGPVNDYDITKKYILYKNEITPNKEIM